MKSVGMDGNGCTFRPHAGLYHPTATLCGRHKLYALTMTMTTTYSQCFGVVLLPRLKCETTHSRGEEERVPNTSQLSYWSCENLTGIRNREPPGQLCLKLINAFHKYSIYCGRHVVAFSLNEYLATRTMNRNSDDRNLRLILMRWRYFRTITLPF